MKHLILFASLLLAMPAVAADATVPGKPRNVILMIADGAGFAHFKAASSYLCGSAQHPDFQEFPVKLGVATFSADGMGYDPRAAATNSGYVKLFPTDSAAAATAMATGFKTANRALGVDPQGRPVSNAVEVAAASGRAAGLVTSVPLCHATPAAFASHCRERAQYAGIAKEMIEVSPLTVLMGGGHPEFDEDGVAKPTRNYDFVGGKDVWERVRRREPMGPLGAWTLVEDRAAFEALATTGAAPARVLGVAPVLKTLQQERDPATDHNGDGRINAADLLVAPPFADPPVAAVPTLARMTEGALRVLGAGGAGLFLMVEGGAGDWASHANQPGRMIEELADFHEAIRSACRWIEANGGWEQNLLIVTADHETGYLSLRGEAGKGTMPGMAWGAKDHTNQLVPLYARGAGSEKLRERIRGTDPVHGPFIDNTDIGRVLFQALAR